MPASVAGGFFKGKRLGNTLESPQFTQVGIKFTKITDFPIGYFLPLHGLSAILESIFSP